MLEKHSLHNIYLKIGKLFHKYVTVAFISQIKQENFKFTF